MQILVKSDICNEDVEPLSVLHTVGGLTLPVALRPSVNVMKLLTALIY
jgi:hypothetical protein